MTAAAAHVRPYISPSKPTTLILSRPASSYPLVKAQISQMIVCISSTKGLMQSTQRNGTTNFKFLKIRKPLKAFLLSITGCVALSCTKNLHFKGWGIEGWRLVTRFHERFPLLMWRWYYQLISNFFYNFFKVLSYFDLKFFFQSIFYNFLNFFIYFFCRMQWLSRVHRHAWVLTCLDTVTKETMINGYRGFTQLQGDSHSYRGWIIWFWLRYSNSALS